MEDVEDVVIVGAGIAGLAVSLGLHRKGITSIVLESSESLRATGFALAIWTNAWRALDELGIADSLRRTHHRLQRIIVTSGSSGAMTAQIPFSQTKKGDLELRCLRRSLLLEALAKELPPGTVRYSSQVVGIEDDGYLKLLRLANGSTVKAKVLIGCDGVNSAVSRWLGLSRPRFSGRSACRGFAFVPEGHGFKPEFLQCAGEGLRFGLLPCDEKNVYWFVAWIPTEQDKEAERDAGRMRELVLSKLRKLKLPDGIMEALEKSDMGAVVSFPLRYRSPLDLLAGNISKDNVAVAGDALHPMTPDLGQGGCSALEDAIVFARSLGQALRAANLCRTEEEEYGTMKKGLEKYARERKWRSFDLVATAWLVGYVMQSRGVAMIFFRDWFFARILTKVLLKKTEFDCGRI